MPKPSREEIGTAIGAIVFLKLSQQDRSKLFEGVTDPVDWGVISNFTRQALRAPRAAGTLSAHFVAHLQVLHAHLEPQMYIGGASPCVADLVCCVALRAAFEAFDDAHKWALCNVSRWFDHMQVALAALAPPAALTGEPVKFNCEVPDVLPSAASLTPLGLLGADGAVAAAADAPVATGAAAPAPAAAAAAPAGDGAPAESQGRNKKAEKEAKKAAKGDKPKKEAAPAAEAAPAQPDASKLDLRVGLILKAEKHPEAEKLYVEQVDLGEGKLRTVVSGLVDFMPPEALTNRRAVLICNLKPAKMRGIESEAMVLAASDVEHTKVELLDPPAAAAIGERVTFEGLGEFAPLAPASKKEWEAVRKAWDATQPMLGTSADRVAVCDGKPFVVGGGSCTVATIANGQIK